MSRPAVELRGPNFEGTMNLLAFFPRRGGETIVVAASLTDQELEQIKICIDEYLASKKP